MKRRDLLKAALALPTFKLFEPLKAGAQTARGMAKITAIKALQLQNGPTLIRIDTDAGISGYGECGGTDGNTARAVIRAYNGGAHTAQRAMVVLTRPKCAERGEHDAS